MSLPTDPTLATLAAEAIQKAGYSSGTSQYTALLTRAQTYWAEEVKNDIFGLVKNPKFLQKTGVVPLTAFKAKYSFPSDFSTPISATLVSGTVSGTAQAGAASTITLASTDSMSAADAEGKEIVITGGTGPNQIRQIIDYNATTKVATVDQAWGTNPSSDSTYFIVDSYDKLQEEPVWNYDAAASIPSTGYPFSYYPEGEKASSQTAANYTGGFIVSPTPDTTYSYAVKIRYYIDMMKVDLDTATDPTITVLYRRWRNVWIQGLFVKALQNQDDNRYAGEFQVYDRLLKSVQAKETYGVDMNDLRMRVE